MSIVTLLRHLRTSPLGRREKPASSAWQVIGWWEARRVPFNVIVGAAGAAAGVAVLGIAVAGELLFNVPFGMPDPPILVVAGVIVYAITAHLCFTGGWVAELIVRRVWPDESERLATLSFTLGLAFAVVVTLLPPFIICVLAMLYGVAQAIGIF